MSGPSDGETFDALFTAAWATVAPDHPAAETIRPAAEDASRGDVRLSGLPSLTIGSVSRELPMGGPDLELQEILGEGGMGVVHRAHQASLARDVAVKQVKPDAPDRGVDALLREARYMGSLEHPNIIPVHALGRGADGRPVLVMKRIDGVAWRVLMRDADHPAWQRGLTPWDADVVDRQVQILVEACKAVHYAHSRGVVHRDLKPDNVMLGELGEVYVIDWGIATGMGQPTRGPVGTPAYMAPEMLAVGAPVDARTDVYLLGACLHEALAGSCRHQGDALEAILAAVHRSEPASYDDAVPAELAAICNRACARQPEDRFDSAADLMGALLAYLEHRGSVRLAEAADVQAQRVAELLDAETVDELALTGAFNPARFGYRQALDQWAENQVAREGLCRMLQQMSQHRLKQNNADAAMALLAELEELGVDVATSRDAAEASRQHAERLQRMERDMDLSVGRGARLFLTASISFWALAVTVLAFPILRFSDFRFTYPVALTVAGSFVAMVVGFMVLGRRWLFANQANRQVSYLMLAGCVLLFMHRLAFAMSGADEAYMFVGDMFVVTMCLVSISVVALPWMWPFTLVWGLGGMFAGWRPDLAVETFGMSWLIATIVTAPGFFVAIKRGTA